MAASFTTLPKIGPTSTRPWVRTDAGKKYEVEEADRCCAGTGWRNVEYRTYIFTDEDGDNNASLIETKYSRESRRGSEIPLTTEELMNIRETAAKTKDGEFHPVQAVQAKV